MEALDRLETVDRTAKSKIQWRQIVSGLADYQNYIHTMIHFCCNYSFAVSMLRWPSQFSY